MFIFIYCTFSKTKSRINFDGVVAKTSHLTDPVEIRVGFSTRQSVSDWFSEQICQIYSAE